MGDRSVCIGESKPDCTVTPFWRKQRKGFGALTYLSTPERLFLGRRDAITLSVFEEFKVKKERSVLYAHMYSKYSNI